MESNNDWRDNQCVEFMKESFSSPKVLVVDDELVHRHMLCMMLTEWGWSCREADDGVTAVEEVRRGLLMPF